MKRQAASVGLEIVDVVVDGWVEVDAVDEESQAPHATQIPYSQRRLGTLRRAAVQVVSSAIEYDGGT
jgi:hypothetical protein